MKSKKTPSVIKTAMDHPVSSLKKSSSRDMAKGPRKYARQEISNETDRPPKR